MLSTVLPDDLGEQVCAWLGLDPRLVVSLTLRFEPGVPPMVEAVHLIGRGRMPLLRRYRLVPLDPPGENQSCDPE